MMPTRIIHQTWRTAKIPRAVYLPQWDASWREQHPEWDYRFWTDDDNLRLVRECYPKFYQGYQKIDKGVVKSDIARVLFLHRFGGMYADMDFICLKPFDTLLEGCGDCIVVGHQLQPVQPFPNAWLYSPAGEEFWLHFVDRALTSWSMGDRVPEHVAGPDRLFKCLRTMWPRHVILPPHVVYPYPWGVPAEDEKARGLDWSNLDELREAYPEAHAVTRWTHNW